jgi:hypothetical protein
MILATFISFSLLCISGVHDDTDKSVAKRVGPQFVYYGKRLLNALFLTLKVSQTWKLHQDKATVDAHGYVLGIHHFAYLTERTLYKVEEFCMMHLVYLHISAWASALLVSMKWAMRDALRVGRVTSTDTHVFCRHANNYSY